MMTAGPPGSQREPWWAVVMVLIITPFLLATCTTADPYVGGIPLETIAEGTVSGGVFIDAYPGFDTRAEKSFLLPDYQKIRWARLYIAVYCGHMENNYPGVATVEFNGGNGWQTLGVETLNVPYTFPGKSGTGPVMVNNHCSRVSSDYLMWYDVPATISSRTVSARVKTEKLGGTGSFDGRVKTITLVAAYDDQDRDKVLYWIAQGHDTDSFRTEQELGESYVGEFAVDTSSVEEDWVKADLQVAYLASRDADYTFNNEVLDSQTPTGAYFGINRWDVTGILEPGEESEITYDNQPNEYYKIFLATLDVRYPEPDTGSLAVFTTPSGATILVDGMEQEEQSNTTITGLSEGSHRVEVEKEGYRKPAEMTVQVKRGETATASFVLTQQSGGIRVSSEPAGATVLLDGKVQQGITPCTLPAIPAGQHQVILMKSGYGDETLEIAVEEGEIIEISADLVPLSDGSSGTGASDTSNPVVSRAEGYAGRMMKAALHGNIQGNISIVSVGEYSGLLSSGDNKTYPFTLTVPERATLVSGRMYVYTTWAHDERSRTGEPVVCTLTLNGRTLPVTNTYLDRKGTGTFDYPAETLVCNLSGDQIMDGENELVVLNSGGGTHAFAVYGAVLMMVWEQQEGPLYYYWIGEGSDIVLSDPEFGITTDEAGSIFEFPGIEANAGVEEARLIVISTAASGEEEDQNRILFNDAEWFNALSAGSSGISRADFDVRDLISSRENRVVVQSYAPEGKGDYLENRNAFLLIRMPPGVSRKGEGLGISEPGTPSLPGTPKGVPSSDSVSPPGTEEKKPDDLGSIGSFRMWFIAVIQWISCSLPGTQDCQGRSATLERPVENETMVQPAGNLQNPLERYTLQVTTDPAGAEVTLDGCLYQERSPLTINDVPAGDHHLVLEMDGCQQESRSITVDENTEILVTFCSADNGGLVGNDTENDSRIGGLYVESYPSGGEISIDGSSTGLKTPHVVYGMQEGSHSIKVTYDREGADEYTAKVWVSAGTLSRVELNDGNHAQRSIEVVSDDYQGAYFTVDGRYPRYRVPATVEVRAWQGFVTIALNGSYISIPVPASVTDGEKFPIRLGNPSQITLSVDSDPPGASIFIDGFPGPVTPALVRNVSAGRHRITLALEDHIPVEREILVIDDPSQEIDASFKGVLVPYVSGAVALNSTPTGAKVYINNRNTGLTTPVVIDHLPIGQIHIKIRFEKSVREPDIVILPGKTVSYHARFT